MALLEISIAPLGTSVTSISSYVTRAIKALREEEKANYVLTAMGTIIEGELEELMRLAIKMHQAVLSDDVNRVLTTIKIDDRRDNIPTLTSKVTAVEKQLGN